VADNETPAPPKRRTRKPAAVAPADIKAPIAKPSYGGRGSNPPVAGSRWGILEPRRGARTLRRFSENNVWVRAAINRRKREISRAKWSICRIDDPKAPPNPIIVNRVTELFRFINPKRESLRSLLDMVVEDILVVDAGCVEKEKTGGGDIVALWSVDGSTIAPDPAWDGSNPKAARYFQYIDGKLVAKLRNDELVYMMANPRTNSVVGFSPLEVLFDTVEAELWGDDYEYRMLKQTAPSGVLDLGAGLETSQVEAFREMWNSEIAGSYDIAIVGGGEPGAGVGTKFVPFTRTAREEQRRDYMKWLATKICTAFEMDLLAFNLSAGVQRSTGNNMQSKSDDGLLGLATLVSEFITREIIWEMDDAHQHGFQFDDLTVREATAQAKIDQIYMSIGVTSPNEIRAREGIDPFPGSEKSPGVPDPEHWANLPYPFNQNTAAQPAEDPLEPGPDDPNAGEDKPKEDGDEDAEEEQRRSGPFAKSASPNADAEAKLRKKLTGITDEFRRRLDRVWDDRKHRIVAIVKDRLSEKSWNAHDFHGALDGISTEMSDALPHREAVKAGRAAVPWDPATDAEPVISTWVNHVSHYAKNVEKKTAGDIADWLHEHAPDETADDVQALLDAFDAKLEAIRGTITRYAEPPWGAGHNGYGAELEDRAIKMIWVLDESADHCGDCLDLSRNSPYDHLPTWPGMGDTDCLDHCKCFVEADPESWAASIAGDTETAAPAREYNPDQPRDEDGKWTSGDGEKAPEHDDPEGVEGSSEPPAMPQELSEQLDRADALADEAAAKWDEADRVADEQFAPAARELGESCDAYNERVADYNEAVQQHLGESYGEFESNVSDNLDDLSESKPALWWDGSKPQGVDRHADRAIAKLRENAPDENGNVRTADEIAQGEEDIRAAAAEVKAAGDGLQPAMDNVKSAFGTVQTAIRGYTRTVDAISTIHGSVYADMADGAGAFEWHGEHLSSAEHAALDDRLIEHRVDTDYEDWTPTLGEDARSSSSDVRYWHIEAPVSGNGTEMDAYYLRDIVDSFRASVETAFSN
jgi:hypothetical protein